MGVAAFFVCFATMAVGTPDVTLLDLGYHDFEVFADGDVSGHMVSLLLIMLFT